MVLQISLLVQYWFLYLILLARSGVITSSLRNAYLLRNITSSNKWPFSNSRSVVRFIICAANEARECGKTIEDDR